VKGRDVQLILPGIHFSELYLIVTLRFTNC
jgi:hypothetical protein